ncbi:low molecular weight phosphotyrosine protein phosphatase [Streptomyces sp. CEV 2-1]|uniref:arsenate-mycothiol transferase ArsC n=1 Tax=Streptomyces sp. CEV 2-1 TaxID=2485153 RepID=UPI000FA062A7|nr:low molecular weight phosphotyrosine protein phosphatase [Streptomyces sp. CEV 2-1]
MSENPKPSVPFVCVHNAGRSQTAAAFLTHLAQLRGEGRSAGSAPVNAVNPAAVRDAGGRHRHARRDTSKGLTSEVVRASDVVITMPTRPNPSCASGVML